MGLDAAYALTRRRGAPAFVIRLLGTSSNPETGERWDSTQSTRYRWVAQEPTRYHRLYRANATQQDIGETTFIFWAKDVNFSTLCQEDRIEQNNKRYEVVTCVQEETAIVVTCREMVR